MIDYKVTILDGLHHDVNSSVLAFELASRACFKACTKRIEIIRTSYESRVVTPEDYMGDVIGDLNSRRGQLVHKSKKEMPTMITLYPFSKYVWLYKQS